MKSCNGKAVFQEVFVKGKGMGYLAGFHDFKADAINQADVAIVERKKPLDGAGIPVAVDLYDFNKFIWLYRKPK